MNHTRRQELRDFVNSYLQDEQGDTVVPKMTSKETAFCVVVLYKQEPDLIEDFLQDILDSSND